MATSSVIENPTGRTTRKPTDLTHWTHPGVHGRRIVHAACGLFVHEGQLDPNPTCPACAEAAEDFEHLDIG